MKLPANLPDLLRAEGLTVVEIPGWLDRGRPASTGGFAPVGTLWHHTAAHDVRGDAADDKAYAEWLAKVGRSNLPAPLCHLSISLEGVVYVCAAGRANHAGVARASGSVAAGDGNTLYVGIECQNDGRQGFPSSQRNAMLLVGKVLHGKVLHTSARAARGHKETSTTGKVDPRPFDMDSFRGDLARLLERGTPNPPEPTRVEVANGKLADALTLIRQADRLLDATPDGRKRVHKVGDALDGTIKLLGNQLERLPEK